MSFIAATSASESVADFSVISTAMPVQVAAQSASRTAGCCSASGLTLTVRMVPVGQFAAPAERQAQAGRLELGPPAGGVRDAEDGVDRRTAVAREAGQGLGGDHRAGRHVDDRLQHDLDRPSR